MEQAALHAHIGRGDARHEARPPGGGFTPGHIPADHVPIRYRYEYHGVAMQVDAIEMHHVNQGHRRPQIPAPAGATPNVRGSPAVSSCARLENSQSRNKVSSTPSRRCLSVLDAPHAGEGHRHRVVPALVVPLRFIGRLQEEHECLAITP